MIKSIFDFGFIEAIAAYFSLNIYKAGWQR